MLKVFDDIVKLEYLKFKILKFDYLKNENSFWSELLVSLNLENKLAKI